MHSYSIRFPGRLRFYCLPALDSFYWPIYTATVVMELAAASPWHSAACCCWCLLDSALLLLSSFTGACLDSGCCVRLCCDRRWSTSLWCIRSHTNAPWRYRQNNINNYIVACLLHFYRIGLTVNLQHINIKKNYFLLNIFLLHKTLYLHPWGIYASQKITT